MCRSVQGGEGGKKNPAKTAGEGGQLSNKGIAEATNSLDLQGTLNHLDSNHFCAAKYRETLETRELQERPRARWVENSCIPSGVLLVICEEEYQGQAAEKSHLGRCMKAAV